jgi:stress response protein YsnF
VSKDARVREELVLHKSIQDRDETVSDTVRRTEVRQDDGDVAVSSGSGGVRNPDGSKP